jgi:serine/threonine protein kinase
VERLGERYVIRRVLGRGGMGEVYEALDVRLGRSVAIKVLTDAGSTQGSERLLREARAAAAFEHPNAVTVFDVGIESGVAYLAMELVRGRGLREYIADKSVGLPQRLRWLIDVARVLDAAHLVGLVHRDIKPENLIVRVDGKIKVLDFGIARAHSAEVDPTGRTQLPAVDGVGALTAAGVFIGTPAYAAPEQLMALGLDGRTDQFSWGVTAYELCTGRLPWSGSPATMMSQIMSTTPVSPREVEPEIPQEVNDCILRAIEKRPEARFATLAELGDVLEPFAALADGVVSNLPRASSGPAEAAITPPARGPSKMRGRALLVGFFAIPLLVGASIHLARQPEKLRSSFAKPTITSLSCTAATLGGEPSVGALGEAIGIGACARLATELGVDWAGGSAASKLSVRARVEAGRSQVDLELAGATAIGTGATPIDAEDAAVQALMPKLALRARSASDIAAWGAKDAAAARSIERAWQRQALRLDARPSSEARAVVERYPDSAWGYLMLANASNDGSQEFVRAIEAGLSRVESLPPARNAAVHGYLLGLRSQADGVEALRLTQAAYAQTPDDPTVIGLHAITLLQVWREGEAVALIERLAATFPTQSVRPLRRALYMRDETPNLQRDQALIQRLSTILPEASAWPHVVDALTNYGLLTAARQNLELGERLGLTGRAFSANAFSRAIIELTALKPAVARQVASAMLSDPQLLTSSRGAFVTIASYRMEGKEVDAQTAQRNEIERLRGAGDAVTAMRHVLTDLQVRRWLDLPPPAAAALLQMEAALPALEGLPDTQRAAIRVEVLLARLRFSPARERQPVLAALADLEFEAERRRDERWLHDGLLAHTVPLLRALKGDRAAAERWRQTERAPFIVRRFVAIDAALALEAIGDHAGAEAAYLLAAGANLLEYAAFDFVAAHVRLVELYRRQGRLADSARIDAVISPLLVQADHGLRASLLGAR